MSRLKVQLAAVMAMVLATAACQRAEPRRRVTSSGRAVYPALSPDGRRLAYAEPHCRGEACAYGILVRDLGTAMVRDLGVEATVIWTIRWSPDGSALLFTGIAGKGWATYLVPAAGGSAIRVAPECAIFSPDGRSLLWSAEMGRGNERHVEVGGLPGTRFVVRGYAEYFMLETAVPDSRWIVVRIDAAEDRDELRAVDLTGAEGGSFFAKGLDAGAVLASRDAVWLQVNGEVQRTVNILRVPFDRQTGQFGAKAETVYTGDDAGSPAIFSVTADGRTLALVEAKTEFGGWAGSLERCARREPAGGEALVKRCDPAAGTAGFAGRRTAAAEAGWPMERRAVHRRQRNPARRRHRRRAME